MSSLDGRDKIPKAGSYERRLANERTMRLATRVMAALTVGFVALVWGISRTLTHAPTVASGARPAELRTRPAGSSWTATATAPGPGPAGSGTDGASGSGPAGGDQAPSGDSSAQVGDPTAASPPVASTSRYPTGPSGGVEPGTPASQAGPGDTPDTTAAGGDIPVPPPMSARDAAIAISKANPPNPSMNDYPTTASGVGPSRAGNGTISSGQGDNFRANGGLRRR